MKILILRLSSIGDILLTTPFIRQVRSKFPKAEIIYIVKKQFADLLRFNPHIDRLIEFDTTGKLKGLYALNLKMQNEKYDLVFDLHNNLRTNRLTKGIEKSKVFKIKKNKIKRAALVYLKINKYKNIITIPQRYLHTGKKTGITDDGKGLELFLGAEDETNPATSFGLNKLQYLCFAPGAAHKTKTWPMENVAELVYRVVTETIGF